MEIGRDAIDTGPFLTDDKIAALGQGNASFERGRDHSSAPPGTRHPTPDTRHPTPDTRHLRTPRHPPAHTRHRSAVTPTAPMIRGADDQPDVLEALTQLRIAQAEDVQPST